MSQMGTCRVHVTYSGVLEPLHSHKVPYLLFWSWHSIQEPAAPSNFLHYWFLSTAVFLPQCLTVSCHYRVISEDIMTYFVCVCVGVWCVLCHLLPGSVPQSSSGQHHFAQPDRHSQQWWTVSLPGESSQLGIDSFTPQQYLMVASRCHITKVNLHVW